MMIHPGYFPFCPPPGTGAPYSVYPVAMPLRDLMGAWWRVKTWQVSGALSTVVAARWFRGGVALSVEDPATIACADEWRIESLVFSGVFGVDGLGESVTLKIYKDQIDPTFFGGETIPAGPQAVYDSTGWWPRLVVGAQLSSYTNPDNPDYPEGISEGSSPCDEFSFPDPVPDEVVAYTVASGEMNFMGSTIPLGKRETVDPDGVRSSLDSWSGSVQPSEYWSFA